MPRVPSTIEYATFFGTSETPETNNKTKSTTHRDSSYERALQYIFQTFGPSKTNSHVCPITPEWRQKLLHDPLSGSGAKLYTGIFTPTKTPVVTKTFVKSNIRTECLIAEYLNYTYIAPFLVWSRITPNMLVPVSSGQCDNSAYVVTPFIKDDLSTVSADLPLNTIIFQIIYTFAAMSYVGMRHNDISMNNIRLHILPKAQTLTFQLKTCTVQFKTKYIPLLYDFDRSTVMGKLATVVKEKLGFDITNPCTTKTGKLCKENNQCNVPVGGRRDLLEFLVRVLEYPIVPSELNEYMWDILTNYHPDNIKYISKYVTLNQNTQSIDFGPNNGDEKVIFDGWTDHQLIDHLPDIEDIVNDPEFIKVCGLNVINSIDMDDSKAWTYQNIDLKGMFDQFVDEMFPTTN